MLAPIHHSGHALHNKLHQKHKPVPLSNFLSALANLISKFRTLPSHNPHMHICQTLNEKASIRSASLLHQGTHTFSFIFQCTDVKANHHLVDITKSIKIHDIYYFNVLEPASVTRKILLYIAHQKSLFS